MLAFSSSHSVSYFTFILFMDPSFVFVFCPHSQIFYSSLPSLYPLSFAYPVLKNSLIYIFLFHGHSLFFHLSLSLLIHASIKGTGGKSQCSLSSHSPVESWVYWPSRGINKMFVLCFAAKLIRSNPAEVYWSVLRLHGRGKMFYLPVEASRRLSRGSQSWFIICTNNLLELSYFLKMLQDFVKQHELS